MIASTCGPNGKKHDIKYQYKIERRKIILHHPNYLFQFTQDEWTYIIAFNNLQSGAISWILHEKGRFRDFNTHVTY